MGDNNIITVNLQYLKTIFCVHWICQNNLQADKYPLFVFNFYCFEDIWSERIAIDFFFFLLQFVVELIFEANLKIYKNSNNSMHYSPFRAIPKNWLTVCSYNLDARAMRMGSGDDSTMRNFIVCIVHLI